MNLIILPIWLLTNYYITLVNFKLLFVISLAVCAANAASLIGMDSLGMDGTPQNSVLIRNGYSSLNPAINAFENKTKFGATIQYEHAIPQNGSNSLSLNSFTTPNISMVLPLGFLGSIGIGMEQKYFANNRIELTEPALDADVILTSKLGIYALTPSYAIRLPYMFSDISIGATYRVFFGNSTYTQELGNSQKWNEKWIVQNTIITQKQIATYESDDAFWRNFGTSIHLHRKNLDWFYSYFPKVAMKKEIKEKVQFSNTDTLKSTKRTEKFELSKHLATGVHYRFLQNQNLSLVYENGDSKSYFVEYKIIGTGMYYSSFLKKNNFGINAWFSEKYLKDVNEFGGSVFSDLWLGRRGTLIGIALYGGYRDAEEPYWDEPFFGFKLNLTGVGNWGTSARRK